MSRYSQRLLIKLCL